MIGDTDYFYTFKCPVCGCETDVKEKDEVDGKGLNNYTGVGSKTLELKVIIVKIIYSFKEINKSEIIICLLYN